MSRQHNNKVRLSDRGAKRNSVCPECRICVRSGRFHTPKCPKCGRLTFLIGSQLEVPKKSDQKGWRELYQRLNLSRWPKNLRPAEFDQPMIMLVPETRDYDELKLAALKMVAGVYGGQHQRIRVTEKNRYPDFGR